MSDNIIVTPGKIRGLGNVLSPKSPNDFFEYNSSLTSNVTPINGIETQVYTMTYDETVHSVSSVSLNADTLINYLVNDSIQLNIQTFSEEDKPLGESTVNIYCNNELLISKTTNFTGELIYNYKFFEIGTYEFKVISNNVESETVTVVVDRQNTNITVED